MENTLENKAKFFAQYYGQEVQRQGDEKEGYSEILFPAFHSANTDGILELTPLSQITDEECLEISKWLENNESGFDARPCNIKTYARVYARKSYFVSDYLRSKGYAVPFMGLSVEELVKIGWVKLKTN